MITVHVIYDKAVFLTNEEYYRKTGNQVNVQCQVEQPEIYMLVLGSSSVEDQAAVIPDRIECLSDLANPVATANGKHQYINIRDCMLRNIPHNNSNNIHIMPSYVRCSCTCRYTST